MTALKAVTNGDGARVDSLADVKAFIANATEDELHELNQAILVASTAHHLAAIARAVERGKIKGEGLSFLHNNVQATRREIEAPPAKSSATRASGHGFGPGGEPIPF